MKIIVYGVGRKGQEFIRDVEEELRDMEIVAITDSFVQKADYKINCVAPYISPSDLTDYEFDYVVVTPQNYFDGIKKELLIKGIEEAKIKSERDIWLSSDKESPEFMCSLCGNKVLGWRYLGEDNDIFVHKHIVGASRRRGRCPICGSSDRERYVYHVLKKHTNIFSDHHSNVLHFAPEKMLYQKLYHRKGYISADIECGRADTVVDITDMQFSDNTFDYIICNHVMEHILLEEKAFLEVKRCLKPNGIFICTVPICWEQETFEDFNICTEQERTKYYGQKDHVRLYGNDIVSRIEDFGFNVSLYRSDQDVSKEYIRKMGYLKKDSVLLCTKKM